ncbi:MAG: TonB C-terminal domain-containing protein [Candidatus Babeliaceae bacterium]|nr:TonB C-terminal domain-containing protein [Candidatus Babeliaceae bacterium]
MLRLLQKKLTPTQVEFIKHLIFVFIAHCMLLLFVVISSRNTQNMIVNIRTFQKADNVIIRWRSLEKSAQEVNAYIRARTKPELLKNNKSASKEPPKQLSLSGKFTKIDLGKRKKKKVNSSYQVPKPPTLEKASEKIIEPVRTTQTAAAQEPLVLSVYEYNDQRQMFEVVDAIRRWWQPPMGVHPEAQCMIMVTISPTGACQDVVVRQSSGIPAYDISAKSAILKSSFPKVVWGKQCILQF